MDPVPGGGIGQVDASPVVVGGVVPHLVEAFVLVVEDVAHDDDLIGAPNLLGRLQLDDGVALMLDWLVEHAKGPFQGSDHMVVDEELLRRADVHGRGMGAGRTEAETSR